MISSSQMWVVWMVLSNTGRPLALMAVLLCSLRVERARPCDVAQGLARFPLLFLGDVGDRDDADEPLVMVDHRHAANLDLGRVLEHVVGVLVVEAVLDL